MSYFSASLIWETLATDLLPSRSKATPYCAIFTFMESDPNRILLQSPNFSIQIESPAVNLCTDTSKPTSSHIVLITSEQSLCVKPPRFKSHYTPPTPPLPCLNFKIYTKGSVIISLEVKMKKFIPGNHLQPLLINHQMIQSL